MQEIVEGTPLGTHGKPQKSTLTIRVVNSLGKLASSFQSETGERIGKVFADYAKRIGAMTSSLMFLLDGQQITADKTPAELHMTDGMEIMCFGCL